MSSNSPPSRGLSPDEALPPVEPPNAGFILQLFIVPGVIVVVVVMDFTAQIQAHLVSSQYESLLKKTNLKNYGRSGITR